MSLLPGLTPWIVALASFAGAGVIAFYGPAQPDPHPSAPAIRCTVPDTGAEPLLQLVAAHFRDPGVLQSLATGMGSSAPLTATIVDDRVDETFYDDQGLTLLQLGAELRHERHLARGELRDVLVLETPSRHSVFDDAVEGSAPTRVESSLSLRDLLGDRRRSEVEAQCKDAGLAPGDLRRSLRVERRRHGIELADGDGPVLLVAVVQCTAVQGDLALRFHECEIGAESARFADPAQRPRLSQLRATVLQGLVGAFPAVTPSATAPYATLFLRLQSNTWLPLRVLHSWNLSDLEAKVLLLLALAIALGGPALVLALRRIRADARRPILRPAAMQAT